ncbi:MAG: radical SAM protein [Oscillospiraceae bacterium]|nr:radical SAM protein [Oscillospiraceae bacterium]
MLCSSCPRECGAIREKEQGEGFCGMGYLPKLAKACIHRWEEPCISGENGSGAVFFTGGALQCVFCQNYCVSSEGFGKTVTVERLREICEKLISQGVHNINLVNPTHYADTVCQLLETPFSVPVVYNTGGYEKVETLKKLKGKIQIYLPDIKYSDDLLAVKYSAAPNYFETAAAAVKEMFAQTGPYVMDEDGILQSGVVIRHLILPGCVENTKRVIDWVSDNFAPGEVLFSLMSQYIPFGKVLEGGYDEINRTVTEEEYAEIEDHLMESNIEEGYFQELSSADTEYIPNFDLENV